MKETLTETWVKIAHIDEFPEDAGVAILIGKLQIAVFNTDSKSRWYATQNLCPHKQEMAISRGLVGDLNGEPKVACPFHKKTFSLENGKCLSGDPFELQTYQVDILDNYVYVNAVSS